MFGRPKDTERQEQARIKRIRDEIHQISERAASLEQMLPNLTDAEAKRKIEQVIESCRLYVIHLSEHTRDPQG